MKAVCRKSSICLVRRWYLAGASAAGRPRLPIRLKVGLLYLKHAYNESDKPVCERWAQDVYFQFFRGEEYFQARMPCDPTNLVRFRQALGEAGVEELLATTITADTQMKAIRSAEFDPAQHHAQSSSHGTVKAARVDDGPKATENDDVKNVVWHGRKLRNAALPTMLECGKPTLRQGFAAPGYARP